jgi:hypothetical protein
VPASVRPDTVPAATPEPASNSELAVPAGKEDDPKPVERRAAGAAAIPVAESPAPAEPAAEEKSKPKPSASQPPKAQAKPAAKPAPKAPANSEPFRGLAAAVSLPALVDSSGQAADERPAPAVLGPLKLPEAASVTAALVGGEAAVRGTRHKFDLEAKADQPRVWQFVLSGVGQSSTIATLAAGAGNLLFEWTDEALKQAAVAKQLCNCTVVLSAGDLRHSVALREPVLGSPLVLDIEKPGTTRLPIGDLPIGKQLFLEVTRVEGPKDAQVEPEQVAVGEELIIWLGDEPKSLPLAVKLDTSSSGRDVEIKQQAHVKLEEQAAQIYRRKDLVNLHAMLTVQVERLAVDLKKTKDSRPRQDAEKLLREQMLDSLARQQLLFGKRVEQLNFATGFTERYGTGAQVHFRIYYQSGEHQLDLYRTEEAAGKAK